VVARSSSVAGFAPEQRPRIAVAADGSLAAIQEPARITVVEVPSCAAFAELGTDPAAEACEVAWVGTPPRLLVLSRFASHSTAHLVDPFGPRTIAEIRLEAPMRLYAAVGAYALAIGAQAAAVLAATDRSLMPYQFPARTMPVTAGAAGTQFMVALPGAIEEWDPQARMPKRRLKLPRPAGITAVGGSDRVVWMTTTQEPQRIDVIPLVNRGQPKAHDLPEPIAQVASHPRSDMIACIGATSGRVWVVDLDGRTGLRMIGAEGIERPDAVGLVLGRVAGVLAAQSQRAITVVTLDRNDAAENDAPRAKVASAPPTDKRSTLYGDADENDDDHRKDEGPTNVTLAAPASPTEEPVVAAVPPPASNATVSKPRTPAPPVTAVAPRAPVKPTLPQFGTPAPSPSSAAPGSDDVLAAWRDRIESPRARTAQPFATLWPEASALWRDEILGWARAVAAGDDAPLLPGSPIEAIARRFDVSPDLEPVLALAYARHLSGHDGIAAIDVIDLQRDITRNWAEALGRGELVASGAATFRGSRFRLADVVLRALDEHAPVTGALVGVPGFVSLLGPCVIVARGPLEIVAEACVSSIGGAILAAHADADPQELAIEARPYGAAPMWRVRVDALARVPDKPFILVADDDTIADALGVPRLT
jgi:hypothetical protein